MSKTRQARTAESVIAMIVAGSGLCWFIGWFVWLFGYGAFSHYIHWLSGEQSGAFGEHNPGGFRNAFGIVGVAVPFLFPFLVYMIVGGVLETTLSKLADRRRPHGTA